ncbi:MAG: type I DNA topoisomerase [Hyphomicrobiales bacterium]|nr:type I DNA topoisomerase [Hyphomicrobiales bacterium]
MILLIVESPAKAKTINKYLGSGYKVLASMGHVRDLPAKSGSIKPEKDFEMVWKTNSGRSKTINDIKKEIQNSEKIILATDPDREGEAISWHLEELFKSKNDKKFERVVFNAVTKDTVLNAIKNPRSIDKDLVEAYKARLSLDYLIGFTISPILWKKLPGAKSAGRVQSVALKIICQRELDVENFKSQKYWTINSLFKSNKGSEFSATLLSRDHKKLNKFDIKSEDEALKIISDLKDAKYRVKEVNKTVVQKKPQPPFTTSTMQQEASKRLRFDPTRTMQVAQRLYEGLDNPAIEGGLITYMRTDGVQIEDSIIDQIRDSINSIYGEKQLPKNKNIYKTKSKNAQESHEAIRPTSFKNSPEMIKSYLSDEQFKLYDLIWKRTIASQMNNAEFERTSIDILVKDSNNIDNLFRATSQHRSFAGYLSVFDDTPNDQEESDNEPVNQSNILISKDDNLVCKKLEDISHQTEPPPRFNAASLIKTLEELGIGRPSTYASILSKLSERNYTIVDQRKIFPTSNGRLVTAFLENYYPDYVQYDFTADLEEKLDQISNGDYTRLSLLNDFWNNLDESTKDVSEISRKEVVEKLNETLAPYIFNQELEDPRKCPECGDGTLTLLSFKEGSFVGCSNYPTCKYQRDLSGKNTTTPSKKIIAKEPETGINITLQIGRYGPYLELENKDPDTKPKRVSVPKNIDLDNISEEEAINLISLPRIVGVHPNTKEDIIGALGRYGPYIKHQNTYVNLKEVEELYDIGLNRAVTLIDEKNKKTPNTKNKLIGKHPKSNEDIIAAEGKYGPYIKYLKKNYSIPKDLSMEEIDLEKAIQLIETKNKKK